LLCPRGACRKFRRLTLMADARRLLVLESAGLACLEIDRPLFCSSCRGACRTAFGRHTSPISIQFAKYHQLFVETDAFEFAAEAA